MRRCLVVATALAVTLAAPAAAQENAVPNAAGMDTLAAEVTPQSWYPDGYYDVRIAAESQVAETPRSPENYIAPCPVGGGDCFDPIDPPPQRVNPGESGPAVSRYGDIALAVSRLRRELAQAGFQILSTRSR